MNLAYEQPRPSAAAVRRQTRKNSRALSSPLFALRAETILALLRKEPLTARQVAERLGVTQRVAWECLSLMHDAAPKLVHHHDWFRSEDTPWVLAAVYGAGDLEDAPRPARKPLIQTNREYRQRQRERARRHEPAAPAREALVAAFFGKR